jgi:hypothetical protein
MSAVAPEIYIPAGHRPPAETVTGTPASGKTDRAARHQLAVSDRKPGRVSKAVRALPDDLYLRLIFLLRMRRLLHLRNPRTYSEKIQWIKLYGSLERFAPFADKYQVREFVTATIGPQHLVPLIGVWDEFGQIPLDALPESFVLKATHGCGYNFICRDKSTLDVASLRQTVTNWLNTNFSVATREPQYRHVRPRLIAEAYLEDEPGKLRDYKFTFSQGAFCMLEVISDRADVVTCNFYDREWNLLPIRVKDVPNTPRPLPKPALLDDMFEVAAKLSAGFAFVRVDLYYAGGNIYFGELTFTPGNGFMTYEPRSFYSELGRKLDLAAVTASLTSS